jgi:hypothetical protein
VVCLKGLKEPLKKHADLTARGGMLMTGKGPPCQETKRF